MEDWNFPRNLDLSGFSHLWTYPKPECTKWLNPKEFALEPAGPSTSALSESLGVCGTGKLHHGKFLVDRVPATFSKNCCFLVCTVFGVLTLVLIVLNVSKDKQTVEHHFYAACPNAWIGLGNKCFYFSNDTRNWTFSQEFCASQGATLVHIETLVEMSFLKRYKGPFDHWIGLSRESSNHTWKWTDNTEHNSLLCTIKNTFQKSHHGSNFEDSNFWGGTNVCCIDFCSSN